MIELLAKYYHHGILSFDENCYKEAFQIARKMGISLRTLTENVNLRGVDFSGLTIKETSFEQSNLIDCNFNNCYIYRCNFSKAKIINSQITDTKLINSYFHNTEICNCIIKSSTLNFLHMYHTDFKDSIFSNNIYEDINYVPLNDDSTPDIPNAPEGDLIGWKKINYSSKSNTYSPIIIKLEIPKDALRNMAFGPKCRCSKAKVLEFQDIEGKILDIQYINTTTHWRSAECKYTKDKMVFPDSFDTNRWKECSNGIHFFLKIEDALKYYNYCNVFIQYN